MSWEITHRLYLIKNTILVTPFPLEKEHSSSPTTPHNLNLIALLKYRLYLGSVGDSTFCCYYRYKFHRSPVTNSTGYLLYLWNLLSIEKNYKGIKRLVFSKLMATLVGKQSLKEGLFKILLIASFVSIWLLLSPSLMSCLVIHGMTLQAW